MYVPGVAGALGTIIHAAVTYRNRGQMSTSIFLMHLRVSAQSMIVGSIAIGVSVVMLQEMAEDWKNSRSRPD